MKKQEILIKLKESNLDANRIIILSGASLVMQDIIEETNDIDLSCDRDYYNQINWNVKTGALGVDIKYYDVYEIGYYLYFPNDIVIIDGYKFLNLEKCLEIKKQLLREKDLEVINKLEKIKVKSYNKASKNI